MIFKLWQEDHEKASFPSVYKFIFGGDRTRSTSCGNAEDAVDGHNATLTAGVSSSSPRLPAEGDVPTTAAASQDLNEKSCHGMDRNGNVAVETVTQTVVVNKAIATAEKKEMQLEPLDESIKRSSKSSSQEEQTNSPQDIRLVVVEEKEEEKNRNAGISNEIAISSSSSSTLRDNKVGQPAEIPPAAVAQHERETDSHNGGNKVIIPVIVLRIDEEEDDVGALLDQQAKETEEEDIKPVGAAVTDRGGGLVVRSGVLAAEEIASIIRNGDCNNNNNNKELIKESLHCDEDDERLLINETTADVHPEPPLEEHEDVLLLVIDEEEREESVDHDDHKADEKEEKEPLPSKESTVSHAEPERAEETKVIVAIGERKTKDVGDAEGVKNYSSAGEKIVCDKNLNSNNEGEMQMKVLEEVTKGDTPLNADRLPIDRVGSRVGGGEVDSERGNTSVRIRRKQYDFIASFDDYITATSSSSMDDLDTVPSFSGDDQESMGSSVMESGSERLTEEWLEEQKRRQRVS